MRVSLVTFPLLLMVAVVASEQPCVKNAWNSFNKKKYKDAIKHADECIKDFGKSASNKQSKLEKDSIPVPPTGKVRNEAEKNVIFSRGLLNDVATAYWIKGRSAEYLYETGKDNKYKLMAKEAYENACVLKYGRCWDPQGWFWSPCEAATERLPIE